MLVFEACELEYVFKLYAYKNECILPPVALFRYWFVFCITPRPLQYVTTHTGFVEDFDKQFRGVFKHHSKTTIEVVKEF